MRALQLALVLPLYPPLWRMRQDEVHERDRNADFMLIILRDLLTIRPNLRLVTELRPAAELTSDELTQSPIQSIIIVVRYRSPLH